MKRLLLIALSTAAFVSCKKDEPTNNLTNKQGEFHYTTIGNAGISLKADQNAAGATFELYTENPENGGDLILSGVFGNDGKFNSSLKLAYKQTELFFRSTSIGLPTNFTIPVDQGSVDFDFASFIPSTSGKRSGSTIATTPAPVVLGSNVFAYMGGFNSVGTPDYLATSDPISSTVLNDLNASLPEYYNNSNSTFVTNNANDLQITGNTDLWVTFAHDGAQFNNSLGYYIYDSQNPPTAINQIDTVFTIFPNVSAVTGINSTTGSGVLMNGSRVLLGSFSANQSIGWVLIKDGYSGTSVDFSKTKFFSNPAFNPESLPLLKRHVALGKDVSNNVYVGFEDVVRTTSNVDNDFNDVVFRVTASNSNAITTSDIPLLLDHTDPANDLDNDGINNAIDNFPNNGSAAFSTFLPYAGGYSSIAFEDLWPNKGDFDFNDLVVSLNDERVLNAQGDVTEINYSVFVRNNGASLINGFGLSLPIPASQVQSVTGTNLTTGLINNAANGVEAGHTNAVIIIFDNAAVNGDTLNVTVTLNAPYSVTQLNQAGNNPFLIANATRGKEVHLAGQEPTALADPSYFGLANDDSNPLTGRYYLDVNNQPWAIEIYDSYRPPVENANINSAYLNFDSWALSNGTQFLDWYEDLPGYRNGTNLQQ